MKCHWHVFGDWGFWVGEIIFFCFGVLGVGVLGVGVLSQDPKLATVYFQNCRIGDVWRV